tara:strand:+ start:3267 stop:4046 length:780 start_codon:yes stop_codon:yes gene_type:complete
MNLIAALTTKNEDWIINKTLGILNKFCDKIVILDDSSEDNTEQICKSFKKVDWHLRKKRENIWDRNEAEGLNELFNIAASYNPQYILMLDADEIPTPNFIDFFNNIDKNVNAWSVRFINLHKDEFHYRTDCFNTLTGINITHDPFLNNGWRKTILVKYDKNYNYTYNFNIKKGGTSKYHPSPQNIPNPVINTEEFYIIHYGKINDRYISGAKDKFYALIEHKDGKGSYQERLKHHYLCRTGSGPNGPIYKKCPDNWFWK